MASMEPEQCPICGWTGGVNDLEEQGGDYFCPACDANVNVD